MNPGSSLLIESFFCLDFAPPFFFLFLGPFLTLYQFYLLDDMWLSGKAFHFIIKLLEMMEHCMTLACK